jgi:hypothetical protein
MASDCAHDVMFGDLCALCGANVYEKGQKHASSVPVLGYGFNTPGLAVTQEVW